MKKKFIASSILASSLFTCLSGGINAFASTVNVGYTPSQVIKKGDFSVVMVKEIKFTDKRRTLPVNLKLANKNGSDYTGGEITIESKVSSKNGFKLKLTNGSDELPYSLQYGKISTTEKIGDQVLGNLTKDKPVLEGNAILPESSQATSTGDYSDILTYTFIKSIK